MKYLSLFLLVVLYQYSYPQAPDWLWAKSEGGTSDDQGYNCSTDANGNIIVTGWFRSSSITFGATTLTNAGGSFADMFIVKYDNLGNVLWAQNAGGTFDDQGYGCTTDANGNIIVTGYFASDSITFGTFTLSDTLNGDMFIVKYSPSGNVLWAKRAGGTSSDGGYGCSTDANGNTLASGLFNSSSITFGTTTLSNTMSGIGDIFIVKYDFNGNVLWAKSSGGTYDDVAYSCSFDTNGNILASGMFNSSSITFETTALINTSTGYYDIFIVKYNPNGNVLWAKSAGGTSNDYSNSCIIDANGNIIIVGYFQSDSLTFGTITLTNSNPGDNDIFIVKLDGGTGIVENNFNNDIKIFPNPTTGKFQIQVGNRRPPKADPSFGGLAVGKEYKIEIYNVLGEKIYSTANMNCETPNEIDLSNRPEGIYTIRLTTDCGIICRKMVIVR